MKKWKGSLSVEASLIVPMVTFVVIGFLYLIFFSHDRVVIWSAALEMAEKAAFSEEGEAVDADFSVIMARIREREASREEERGTASASAALRIPLAGTATLTGSQWGVSYTVTSEKVDYMKDRWTVLLKEGEKSGDHLQ